MQSSTADFNAELFISCFQIEECAMIPAKEAKEMLYKLFGENFVALTVRHPTRKK